MTRSFLGASLITLTCLSLAAACGDDEGDNNNGTGGRGGGASAGTGGRGGSGGSGNGGTGMAGRGGTTAAGGTSMGGSTNTGVELDAGLGGGASGEDAGGPGGEEEDAGGGGPQVDPAFAAFQATVFPVLQARCNNCHVGNNPSGGAGIGINNAQTAFAEFTENTTGGPRYNLIVTRLTNGSMPPACPDTGPGSSPQCVTQAQFDAIDAWVDQFGD